MENSLLSCVHEPILLPFPEGLHFLLLNVTLNPLLMGEV